MQIRRVIQARSKKLRRLNRLSVRNLTTGGRGQETVSTAPIVTETTMMSGLCPPRQAKEFARGRDYGRPSHPHSWEATVSSPWYVENYRRGEGYTMVGCDLCHKNMSTCDNFHIRHLFSAEEARRPEACAACHMGPDHPDWESYEHSKWGTIYHTFGDRWDWEKRLSEVIPGKDYLAPTCQYCHMYVGDGRWEMRSEERGIWRMGVIPPKEVEFKSGL